jgi:hypothetical protein
MKLQSHFLKTFKKKFSPEKLRSKMVFCTRVVGKLFFEIVGLYTKFYAVICALFIVIIIIYIL